MKTSITLTILAVVLGCYYQPSKSAKILAICPINSKSHFAMCGRLAKGLAAKGHQVDMFSHYPSKKQIPNLKDFSLDGGLPSLTNNLSYSNAVQFQITNFQTILDQVGNPPCELMSLPVFQELLRIPPKDLAYDLVITEIFICDCYLAWGRHLNVPMIGISSLTFIDWYSESLGDTINPAIMPGLGSPFIAPMNFVERLINTVMSLGVSTIFNQVIKVQNKYIERYFGSGYPDVVELRKDLDLLLLNTHHSLEGLRPYTPAVVPVSGLHIEENDAKLPKEVQKWLDESKDGCIYFSFGSMIIIESFPKSILEAFYATFKNIAPVRVLLKIVNPDKLLPGLPSNVMTQSWFPQIQVLKHENTKAFVTHGGLLSALEAIYANVPMVGIPIFGDQHTNVKANVRRGISTVIELDDINEEKLTTNIKEILNNPNYRLNTEKLSRKYLNRPIKPLDEAIFWVEYIYRHGKNSLRSPLVDMHWWKVNLFDVYAFLISTLAIFYYILKFSLKKIYSIYFLRRKSHVKDRSKKKR